MTKSTLIVLLALRCGDGFAQEIKFESVPKGKPLKRSCEYQMYWTESPSPPIVSIQFRKNDLVVHEVPGFLKYGKYVVYIPGMLRGDYSLVVVDPANQLILRSQKIVIERKIPLVLQLGAVVALTLALSLLPV